MTKPIRCKCGADPKIEKRPMQKIDGSIMVTLFRVYCECGKGTIYFPTRKLSLDEWKKRNT